MICSSLRADIELADEFEHTIDSVCSKIIIGSGGSGIKSYLSNAINKRWLDIGYGKTTQRSIEYCCVYVIVLKTESKLQTPVFEDTPLSLFGITHNRCLSKRETPTNSIPRIKITFDFFSTSNTQQQRNPCYKNNIYQKHSQVKTQSYCGLPIVLCRSRKFAVWKWHLSRFQQHNRCRNFAVFFKGTSCFHGQCTVP